MANEYCIVIVEPWLRTYEPIVNYKETLHPLRLESCDNMAQFLIFDEVIDSDIRVWV